MNHQHFVITLVKDSDESGEAYVQRCQNIAAYAQVRSSFDALVLPDSDVAPDDFYQRVIDPLLQSAVQLAQHQGYAIRLDAELQDPLHERHEHFLYNSLP